MPKVKYIGANTKTDSITGVGLQWEPGQVRDVTSTVAAHLLSYSDTWVREGEEGGESPHAAQREAVLRKPGDETEPIDFLEEDKRAEEPLPVVDFHGMNKDELVRFAEDRYGEKLNKRNKEQDLREQVIKLHTKHEMEDKAG